MVKKIVGNELKIADNMIYIEEGSNILAMVEFKKISPTEYDIYHTFVDEKLRGQGIASTLVGKAVKEISSRGYKVQASCSYANAWLKKRNI